MLEGKSVGRRRSKDLFLTAGITLVGRRLRGPTHWAGRHGRRKKEEDAAGEKGKGGGLP